MASSQDLVIGQQNVEESDSRSRTLTEKGREYQMSLAETNFKSNVSNWRRCSNRILILLSDSEDTHKLRQERELLRSHLEEMHVTLHSLENLKGDCHSEFLKLEAIETEHQSLLHKVTSRLLEVESNRSETKSQCSKASHKSKSSRVSKLSEAAAKRAALETELKFIDVESKYKTGLQKIQTMKQLEIAKAEENALGNIAEQRDADLDLSEYDKTDLVQDFILAQSMVPAQQREDPYASQENPISNPIVCTAEVNAGQINQSGHEQASLINTGVSASLPTPVNSSSSCMSSLATSTSLAYASQSAFVSRRAESVPASSPHVSFFTPTYVQANTAASTNMTAPICSTGTSSVPFTQSGQGQDMSELTKVFVDQVSLSRLPSPEPGVFSGDPLTYPAWKAAFQTLIEQRRIPPSERIYYLKRYVSGPVRDVVDGFFLLPSDEAYIEAKRLLDKRFGDQFVLANAFRDKLELWPKISSRDGTSLRKFSDFLGQCQIAMRNISSLSVLNDDRENRKLLSKLPDWVVNKWNRVAHQHKEQHQQFPPFKVFVEFLTKEANIACDSVTSLQSLKTDVSPTENKSKTFNEKRTRQSRGVFLSNTEETPNHGATSDQGVDRRPAVECTLCKRHHELDKCFSFLAKSLEDRKSFVRNSNLCFACLGSGHISKKCQKRKKCQICKKSHPTSLHGDVKRRTDSARMTSKNEGATNHSSVSCASLACPSTICCRSSMIVPVFLSHESGPNQEVLVYAMLDTQSDTTFVLESTLSALGLSGTPVRLSLSTMYAENQVIDSKRVSGLKVRGFDSQLKISLPDAFTRDIMPANRGHIPTPEVARSVTNLESVAEHLIPLQECEIGLLIGYNCPRAMTPREVVISTDDGPFAQRTDLGWGIVGFLDSTRASGNYAETDSCCYRTLAFEVPNLITAGTECAPKTVQFCARVTAKEVLDPMKFAKILESDFAEQKVVNPFSREDQRFIDIMSKEVCVKDSKYTMPLPFKGNRPNLPDNRCTALSRLNSLKRHLSNDVKYKQQYFDFMQNLIDKGFAERVPEQDLAGTDGQKWYVPHHGVRHPAKPNKLRVVYDCSAKYRGTSLNEQLLSGPDLTNLLVGVLCRFRQEPVAFMCDIEQMFYQFQVSTRDRDYLRFLWFDSHDIETPPVDFRMTVHLFGATSSPGCANFGLKRIARDFEAEYGKDVADFVHDDFYVDDGLKSVSTCSKAVSLFSKTQDMLSHAGIRLCKFVSNSKEVSDQIKPEDKARDPAKAALIGEHSPIDRVLGVLWCVDSDSFQFRMVLRDRPLTRRGILSVVSSIYDPLGLIAPAVLPGKQILQLMCAKDMGWDDPLPDDLQKKWLKWCFDIQRIQEVKVKRCLKPESFVEIKEAEMHHFSDASSQGYGQCSYLRLVDKNDQVHCSLLMGKSRVTPLKTITIPRLELSAAVVSVRISTLLGRELQYENLSHFFWTDSSIVLGYVKNDGKRFHVFVANRVSQIREHSEPCQWRHVTTDQNPADCASRGVTVLELQDSNWFCGPTFLWERHIKEESLSEAEQFMIPANDPELKRCSALATETQSVSEISDIVLESLENVSDLNRAKRIISLVLRFIYKLKERIGGKACPAVVGNPTIAELQMAERQIVRLVQRKHFKQEYELLESASKFHKSDELKMVKKSSLYSLNPFLDNEGIIRVGGRLQNAKFEQELVNPVVLPRKCHTTNLVIRHYHEQVQHQGRGMTVSQIRSAGFWIIGCGSAVSYYISKCVICRKLRGTLQTQRMADLPEDRLSATPPFTYVGVDYFGPWVIKEGRRELKRYGVVFTCLGCRAIHLETANSLDTSSFINALRRFIAIRGPIRQLRSDRGTNFVGAERELREAVGELDEERIVRFLQQKNCDYFSFKFNVPSASHMGGVWERQIRTVRNVLSSLLLQSGSHLDDESLRTFMCEVSAIVNSRPLTVENLNDPSSVAPLTPNHLLTTKTDVVLPPPGEFTKSDLYCRRRWRRIQYLANQFWYRWKREYLQCLQVRNKWQKPKRNFRVGDIVLVVDENLGRSEWKLARILETYSDDDGLVRKVRLNVSGSSSSLERPIHKLVLVLESE